MKVSRAEAAPPAGQASWDSLPPAGAGREAAGAAPRARRAPGLALDHLWFAATLVGCFVGAGIGQILPNDFWWHLRTGQIIVQTGAIPTADLFTFTRLGQPWTNQSWLTEALFYLLYRAGGVPLLLFWQALVMAAAYLFLQLACLRRAGGRVRPAVLATFAAMLLGMVSWGLRPQTASFLCFGLLCWLIAGHQGGKTRAIWGVPLLFLAWVNLHGGFVFGLGLFALYLAGAVFGDLRATRSLSYSTRRLLAAGGVTLLALCANPAGPLGIVRYVLGFFSSQATQALNQEFAPLSAREAAGQVFFVLTLASIFLLFRRRDRLPGYAIVALLLFGAATLYSIRVVPWYGMVLAPALGQLLAAERGPLVASRPVARRRRTLNYVLAGLLLLLAAAGLPWLRPILPLKPDQRGYVAPHETPAAAAGVLCQLGPGTRVYAEIGYASYLAWACPGLPLFMDTRFELYTWQMWQDYIAVTTGRYDWQRKLAGYGVNAILASKREQPVLVEAARAAPGWQLAYEDEDAALFRLAAAP